MKIIKTDSRNDSKWTNKIVEAKSKKFSSIQVNAGKVMCPMTNGLISTINCELCEFCKGIDLNIASSKEFIKCAKKESSELNKTAEVDEVERLFVSEKLNNKNEDTLSLDDFKSIFANSNSKLEDINENDIMNSNKIVSAKNINESKSGGTPGPISKFNNSIFDSNILKNLNESYAKEEEIKTSQKLVKEKEEQEARKEWEKDLKNKLGEIGYSPKGKIMSISHEAKANNPDVSEYKFSVFDNIDEKLKNIPELTDGEKLKQQSKKRKQDISRTKEEYDWESNYQNSISSSKITNSLYKTLFGE